MAIESVSNMDSLFADYCLKNKRNDHRGSGLNAAGRISNVNNNSGNLGMTSSDASSIVESLKSTAKKTDSLSNVHSLDLDRVLKLLS